MKETNLILNEKEYLTLRDGIEKLKEHYSKEVKKLKDTRLKEKQKGNNEFLESSENELERLKNNLDYSSKLFEKLCEEYKERFK